MLKLWRVETKNGDWTNYADCNFTVIAETFKEAYRKAVELEGKENIKRVYMI